MTHLRPQDNPDSLIVATGVSARPSSRQVPTEPRVFEILRCNMKHVDDLHARIDHETWCRGDIGDDECNEEEDDVVDSHG